MKQKIIIKVHVKCDKCRSKAMKLAAVEDGVISVALEGDDKDKLVVTGERVDAANLTIRLSKKIGHASLVSVGEVKPKPPEKKPDVCQCNCQHGPCRCNLYGVVPVYDPEPRGCTIM